MVKKLVPIEKATQRNNNVLSTNTLGKSAMQMDFRDRGYLKPRLFCGKYAGGIGPHYRRALDDLTVDSMIMNYTYQAVYCTIVITVGVGSNGHGPRQDVGLLHHYLVAN